MSRHVPLRRKLAGLAVGTLGSLLTLEGALWVVYAFQSPVVRAVESLVPRPGERHILCMGDSNTYGVYLRPELSYPGRLQTYLDRRADNSWRVFNLGYPGQNTAQMRARLAANLDAYRPEVLILWGGMNNTWSPAMSHLWDHPDSEPEAAGWSRVLAGSRAYKALRMMFLEGRLMLGGDGARRYGKPQARDGDYQIPGLDGAQRGEGLGDVETVDSGTQKRPFKVDEVRHSILTDLRRIHAICRERGVALVLARYWTPRPWVDVKVNSAIDEFAQTNGLPVVPLRERIRPLLTEYGKELFLFKDGHANAFGNQEVARQVLLTLIEARLLEPHAEWTAVPPAEAHLHLALEILGRKGRVVDLELGGPPGRRFALETRPLVRIAGRAEAELLEGVEAELVGGGRVNAHGGRVCRVELPRIDGDAVPADATVVGWRLEASVFGAAPAEGGVEPLLFARSVDLALEPAAGTPGEDQ